MASVWYVGRVNERTITGPQWNSATSGAGYADTTWDASNGWSLPESAFDAEQLDFLNSHSDFRTNQEDGPRQWPPPPNNPPIGALGGNLSSYAYYIAIKVLYDAIMEGGPGGGDGITEEEVEGLIEAAINGLIDSAPGTLDTLGEIATLLQENDGAIDALTTALGTKVSKTTTPLQIYGTDGAGAQTLYLLDTNAGEFTAVARGLGGTVLVGTPTANGHATTKLYVDSGLGGKLNTPGGTPNGTKFLRDDNIWSTPPGGGGGTGTVETITGSTYLDVDDTDPANPVLTVVGLEPEITAGTTAQYLRGDKTLATLNADVVPDGTTNKAFTAVEKSKLANIELLADVTDATNVDAAGAVMNSDTSTADMAFVNNSTVGGGDGVSTTKVPTQFAVYQAITAFTVEVNTALSGYVAKAATSTTGFGFVVDEDNMVSDSATKVPTQQSVKAYADTKIALTQKGAANGVAELDSGGKVPSTQLPNSIMEYVGTWNASTNTPTLSNGTGSAGNVYRVTVAGSQNLGSGAISFDVGDYAIHNGTVWEKSDTTDSVPSVAGLTGAISAANLRTALSLVVGTDVQAYNTILAAIAALTPTNDNVLQVKGGAVTQRTPAQLSADLPAVVGDSGAGGTKGLVPAPAAGDNAGGKFLRANGTWAVPAGGAGSSFGTFASLPAAGNTGAMYYCTDIDLILRDNGSSWDRIHIGSEGGVPTAPPTSGWSTSLGGSATVTADRDGRLFTVPSVAGVNWRIEYRTLSPTSNYTFTAYIESAIYQVQDGYACIILRNSSSGSFIVFGHSFVSTIGFNLASVKYSSPTVGIAVYANQSVAVYLPEGLPKWLRVRDNGTNRFFEYSYNGLDWQLHSSQARTDFITPDQIGWGAHASGGQTNYARMRSFSLV